MVLADDATGAEEVDFVLSVIHLISLSVGLCLSFNPSRLQYHRRPSR